MNHIKTTSLAVSLLVLSACQNKKNSNNTQTKTDTTTALTVTSAVQNNSNTDSLQLTKLVRDLYKWHETVKLKYTAGNPVKSNPADSLYSGIDLKETEKSVNELKASGLFAVDFLNEYRDIFVRMDKELKDGSSSWREGDLPTFNDDVDSWCNCQDYPDNYWKIIKLTSLKIAGNQADFKWTWGDDFFYHAKAQKADGRWSISYLEGFDMKAYNWAYNKTHPSK